MKPKHYVNMPVITIHIDESSKKALQQEADKNGLLLTAYCRQILLQSLSQSNLDKYSVDK